MWWLWARLTIIRIRYWAHYIEVPLAANPERRGGLTISNAKFTLGLLKLQRAQDNLVVESFGTRSGDILPMACCIKACSNSKHSNTYKVPTRRHGRHVCRARASCKDLRNLSEVFMRALDDLAVINTRFS